MLFALECKSRENGREVFAMPEPVVVKKEALKIVDGVVIDKQVKVALCPLLDKGPMPVIRGIVMHPDERRYGCGNLKSVPQSISPSGRSALLDRQGWNDLSDHADQP